LSAQGTRVVSISNMIVRLLVLVLAPQAYSSPFRQDNEVIQRLIEDLASQDVKVRERATIELITIGDKAISFVRAASSSKDSEVAARARLVLDEIAINRYQLDLEARGLSKSVLKSNPNIVRQLFSANESDWFLLLDYVETNIELVAEQVHIVFGELWKKNFGEKGLLRLLRLSKKLLPIDSLAKVKALLSNPSDDLRLAAFDIFKAHATGRKLKTSELVEVFQLASTDRNPAVRIDVVETLSRVLQHKTEMEPQIATIAVKLLNDSERSVQESSIIAISACVWSDSEPAQSVFKSLVALLSSCEERSAVFVLESLKHLIIGQTSLCARGLDALKERPTGNELYREHVAAYLEAIGKQPQFLEAVSEKLYEMLEDPSARVSLVAGNCLGRLCVSSNNELVAYERRALQLLKGDKVKNKEGATALLVRICLAGRQLTNESIQALTTASISGTRESKLTGILSLAEALVETNKSSSLIVASLRESLRDSDPEIRSRVLLALGKAVPRSGQIAQTVLNDVASIVRDPSYEVREMAAWALGRVSLCNKELAEKALESLQIGCADPVRRVRVASYQALAIASLMSDRVSQKAGELLTRELHQLADLRNEAAVCLLMTRLRLNGLQIVKTLLREDDLLNRQALLFVNSILQPDSCLRLLKELVLFTAHQKTDVKKALHEVCQKLGLKLKIEAKFDSLESQAEDDEASIRSCHQYYSLGVGFIVENDSLRIVSTKQALNYWKEKLSTISEGVIPHSVTVQNDAEAKIVCMKLASLATENKINEVKSLMGISNVFLFEKDLPVQYDLDYILLEEIKNSWCHKDTIWTVIPLRNDAFRIQANGLSFVFVRLPTGQYQFFSTARKR